MSIKILKTWDEHVAHLRQLLGGLPDRRTGDNTSYSMEDIGLGAFSVFFTQCPSFLARQKTMQHAVELYPDNRRLRFRLERMQAPPGDGAKPRP